MERFDWLRAAALHSAFWQQLKLRRHEPQNTERTEGKYVMRDVTKPVPDARLPAAMIRGMIVLWWAYGLCPYHVVFRANY